MKILFLTFFAFAVVIAASGLGFGQAQNQPQIEDEKVYLSNEVDEKIIFKLKPRANHTNEARKYGISGSVLLRGIFRPNGKIESIKVVKGLDGGLTESAIKAMKKIKFIPARKGGKEVSVSQQVEYVFITAK